jgi:hypothetical protein
MMRDPKHFTFIRSARSRTRPAMGWLLCAVCCFSGGALAASDARLPDGTEFRSGAAADI